MTCAKHRLQPSRHPALCSVPRVARRASGALCLRALLWGVVGMTVWQCKPVDNKKSRVPVRERSAEDLPPMEAPSAGSDASAALMRPEASLPGAAVLMIGGVRSCLVARVAENFLLTAASCVFDPQTGYPRPGFMNNVRLTLGWTRGAASKKAEVTSLAVYAHESFIKHFAATKGKPTAETYGDKAALAQVADLALVEIQTKESLSELGLSVIAEQLPPRKSGEKAAGEEAETTPVVALQGFCGGSATPQQSSASNANSNANSSSKADPAWLDGGRLLPMSWQPGVLRAYVADAYKSTRALFDCEGFRGAPVFVEGTTELMGIASWVHEGSTERGVTLVAGDAAQPGSLRNWIAERIKAKRDFKEPELNTLLSCRRKVETSLGAFEIALSDWPVRLENDRIAVSFPKFSLGITVSAVPAPPSESSDPKDQNASSPSVRPLLSSASAEPVAQTFKMSRDVRQPGFLQFFSDEKVPVGWADLSATFVSTDGQTGLVVLVITERSLAPKDSREQSVNIFLDKIEGPWCSKRTPAPL